MVTKTKAKTGKEQTLFLAWRNASDTKDGEKQRWFPIGRLDIKPSGYRFRYIKGANRAQREVNFPLPYDFPKLEEDYRSPHLFAMFGNRVMAKSRPDRADYLSWLGLKDDADPFQILSVSGGRRMTDFYEVFPKITKDEEGNFTCRFFLRGWRDLDNKTQERVNGLAEGAELRLEPTEKDNGNWSAVRVFTEDGMRIGWAPRYLAEYLVKDGAGAAFRYSAKVFQNNPAPVPANQRILIEMQGQWQNHEPMSSDDFTLLVGTPA